MDVETGVPRTRLELARHLAADAEMRRRLVEHGRRRFRLSAHEIEDLMQETALELIRRDGPVREPAGLAFHVFHFRCLQYLRKRGVRGEALEGAADLDRADPGTGSQVTEATVLLGEALASVSAPCRRLLVAHYLEGFTFKETAEKLAYASSSVAWTLLARCLRRLRGLLGTRA